MLNLQVGEPFSVERFYMKIFLHLGSGIISPTFLTASEELILSTLTFLAF
jgi:hypothetical protein